MRGDSRQRLIKYLDPKNNPNIDPKTVSLRDKNQASFKCPDCGHTWKQNINSFINRRDEYGCAKCANRRVFAKGHGISFLGEHPEAIQWLDKSKYTLEEAKSIRIAYPKTLNFICIHCKESFSGTVKMYKRQHNKHLSGKCVRNHTEELDQLITRVRTSIRFKVFLIELSTDWDKFLKDLQQKIKPKFYSYFKQVYINKLTYREAAEIEGVSHQYIGTVIKKVETTINTLIDENHYTVYQFGRSKQKLPKEIQLLKDNYLFLTKSIIYKTRTKNDYPIE